MTQSNAATYCTEGDGDAHLVSINSAVEQVAVTDLINQGTCGK